MTGKADFSEAEWETVLEGPTSAGLIVSAAQRGGTFREAFAMSKVYAEARRQHGDSQLLDEIVAHKPKIDRERAHSSEELRDHALQNVRDAVALVKSKAAAEELGEYRSFVLTLAERVAAAKSEGSGGPVSDDEQQAIDSVKDALSS